MKHCLLPIRSVLTLSYVTIWSGHLSHCSHCPPCYRRQLSMVSTLYLSQKTCSYCSMIHKRSISVCHFSLVIFRQVLLSSQQHYSYLYIFIRLKKASPDATPSKCTPLPIHYNWSCHDLDNIFSNFAHMNIFGMFH